MLSAGKLAIPMRFDAFDWERFDVSHREVPQVFRGAYRPPPFTSEEIVAALVDEGRRLRDGVPASIGLYGEDASPPRIGRLRSARTDTGLEEIFREPLPTSLEQLSARIRSLPGFERYMLFWSTPHCHRSLWRKMFAWATCVVRRRGEIPTAMMTSDVFIGNYARTTFGAHRDPLHNYQGDCI